MKESYWTNYLTNILRFNFIIANRMVILIFAGILLVSLTATFKVEINHYLFPTYERFGQKCSSDLQILLIIVLLMTSIDTGWSFVISDLS